MSVLRTFERIGAFVLSILDTVDEALSDSIIISCQILVETISENTNVKST